MGKKKKTTIGYKYYMGLHMGLCRGPVDAIRQIRVGDKQAWAGEVAGNDTITINKPNLFGGEEQEGGIVGKMDVMMGAPAQGVNARLAAMLGGLVSAFRGVATTFFDGLVCAMSPYPKEWSYFVQKTKKGWHNDDCWYPSKCEIPLPGGIPVPVDGQWSWVKRTDTFVVGATHEYTGSYTNYQGWWKGWMHSFRITKGVARYPTPEYDPPSAPFPAGAADPYDEGVVLLIDATTGTIKDHKGHVITLLGAPFVSSSQTLFGQSTIRLDGVDDALLVQMDDDADLGEGPWTMDAWVWLEDDTTSAFSFGLFGHGVPSVASQDTRWELLKSMLWTYSQAPSVGVGEPSILQNIDPKGEVGRWMFVSICWDGDSYWMHQDGKLLTGVPNGYAMNPAHILRRLYTDPAIGRGLPASRMDEPSWQAAADTLFSEGFGLCMKWSRTDSVASFAEQVINHAGAVVYTSRRTGKIVLSLIRGGYDVSTLPEFTPDTGLLGFDDDQSGAVATGINEIVVKYFDPLEKTEKAVREKNLGVIMAMGGVTVTEEVSYPGLPTEDLARRVARRDLQIKSGYIKRFTVRLDRRGADIVPGSVFKVSDPARGISSLALRAGRVEYGTITSGEVVVTALQDVFGLPDAVYREPEENGYVPPDTRLLPPAYQVVQETSYRDLVQLMPAADLAALPDDAGHLSAAAMAPTAMSQSFALAARVAPVDFEVVVEDGAFCRGGALAVALDYLDTTVSLANPSGLSDDLIGTAALIGDEIVVITGVDDVAGELTVGRGCADTLPRQHAAGTPVLCYEGLVAVDAQNEYVDGTTVEAKLLTNTGGAQLPMSGAPTRSVGFASRAFRPYPPADVKINGQYYPDDIGPNDVEVEWVHRNRLTQADVLVDFLQASVAPEDDVTYSIEYYEQGNPTALDDETGITGTAATAWAPPTAGSYRIELWSVRDGVASRERFVHVLASTVSTDPYWGDVVGLLLFESDLNDKKGYTWTEHGGGVAIETTMPIIGEGSAKFTASGEWARSDAGSDHVFGTGDFTFECFLRPASVSGVQIFLCKQPDDSDKTAIQLRLNDDAFEFVLQPYNSVTAFLLAGPNNVIIDRVYHVAAVRESGVVSLFVDGVRVASGAFSGDLQASGNAFMIGAFDGASPGSSNGYDGLMDELRLTKGVARYRDFYVPADPYAMALLHFEDDMGDVTGRAWTVTGTPAYTDSPGVYGRQWSIPSTSVGIASDGDGAFDFSESFTCELFITPSQVSGMVADAAWPVSLGVAGTATAYTLFGVTKNQTLRFHEDNGGSDAFRLETASAVIALDQRHHIAVSHDKPLGKLRLFVDGVKVAERSVSGVPTRAGTNTLNINHRHSDYAAEGAVDEFRYTRCLCKYREDFDPHRRQVTALLHFEGANNSTDIKDAQLHTWTAASGAKLSTDEVPFGATALKLGGSGAYVYTASDDDFGFGTGDFTIECFAWQDALNNEVIFDLRSGAADKASLVCFLDSGNLCFYDVSTKSTGNAISAQTWTHVAMTREAGTLRMFIGGQLGYTGTKSSDMGSSRPIRIGKDIVNNANFVGYLKDFRVTKGVARYTDDFAPPSGPLPDVGGA